MNFQKSMSSIGSHISRYFQLILILISCFFISLEDTAKVEITYWHHFPYLSHLNIVYNDEKIRTIITQFKNISEER